MKRFERQLNMLEVMGYRRSHIHKSIDSTSAIDITVPTVDNNLQYDSPTISRVTKQFAENIGRLSQYILENAEALKTTNLSTYITTDTSDENGMNKIFVAAPCAMTSQRTLELKNSIDIQAVDDVPPLLASFMIEDKLSKNKYIVGVTSSSIIRLKINDAENGFDIHPNVVKIYDYSPEIKEENDGIKRCGFADANRLYIYIITNKDIRLFKTLDVCNDELGSVAYSNIVDFKNSYSDNHHRYDENLVIEDMYRQNTILSMIVSGNFHEFVDKYYKLGDFPSNVLDKQFYSDNPNPVTVYDVGIVTGKYGIYQIHCYSAKPKNINEFDQDYTIGENPSESRGSLHIKCLNNKPVKDAFFYEDKGTKYLIAINGWPKSDEEHYSEALDNEYKGVTVIRLDEAVAASVSTVFKLSEHPEVDTDWTDGVPSTGYVYFDDEHEASNNVTQILASRGINGPYVNKLKYKTFENEGVNGFLIKYDNPYYNNPDGSNCWFFELGDQKLWVATKDYSRHEFNCLSEYKINEAAYYMGNNSILFYIKGIGLVEGIKEYDKVGNTGFRFKIVKTEESFGADEKILSIYVMNRCFVAVSKKKIFFVISNGDSNYITLNKDINTNVKEIQYSCTYDESNAFCIGYNKSGIAKLAIIYLKYDINTKNYTDNVIQNLSELISNDFMAKDNSISRAIDKHIKDMHGPDSIIDKLNSIINMLKNRSVMQSTGLSDNLHISEIVLNYPNNGDDFAYVETDENSTNIYGRINSKTVNANPSLTTVMKRNSNAITYYDTVLDQEGNTILSTNKLVYSMCKLSPTMTRLTVNVPSTGTYYVDNIIGWSGGSRTGSALMRKNLDEGFIQGQIESCTTRYQLVLNRVFFDIKNILNVTAQLTSVPLKIYSNINEFDIRHYGMYDSPIVAPLNLNSLTDTFEYDMSDIDNDEIALSFSIFGGDALQINILIENYEQ
jgi:hypothetical protein